LVCAEHEMKFLKPVKLVSARVSAITPPVGLVFLAPS
jgi:hypothetical protein